MEISLSNYFKKIDLPQNTYVNFCANSVITTKEQQAENAENGYKP